MRAAVVTPGLPPGIHFTTILVTADAADAFLVSTSVVRSRAFVIHSANADLVPVRLLAVQRGDERTRVDHACHPRAVSSIPPAPS